MYIPTMPLRQCNAPGTRHSALILTALVPCLLAIPARAQWIETAKLLAFDGDAGDTFGWSVSLSGDQALVGAPTDESDAPFSHGSAYVFALQGDGTWTQVAKLNSDVPDAGDKFGASVSLSGDRALIGDDHRNIGGGTVQGSAYIFERQSDGTWNQITELVPSDGVEGDVFGGSVSLEGERGLIGSYSVPTGTTSSDLGSGYIVERQSDGTWIEVAELLADDRSFPDEFGASVSLSGDRALIGSPRSNGPISHSQGAAYVFERQGDGTWAQVAKLSAGDAAADDLFGNAVSLMGDRAVIGAPGDDREDGTPELGSAYVFERQSDGTWTEVAKLVASDAVEFGGLGGSVSLSGDRTLVGGHWLFTGGGVSAYVFERQSDGTWTESAKLMTADGAAEDKFGWGVSLSGDRALVGAFSDDIETAGDQGSAYVFELIPGAAPIADAGDDQSIVSGQAVTLDGTGSSDPDDDPISYTWMFTAMPPGSGAALDDPTLPMPTFCGDLVGVYEASLTVNDGTSDSEPDLVTIVALTPDQALGALVNDVEALGPAGDGSLNRGETIALTRKLVQAQRLLDREMANGALGVLSGFRKQVEDLRRDGVLSETQAEELLASVDGIMEAIGDPCSVGAVEAARPAASLGGLATTEDMPTAFTLKPAYPNPFNPSTTISFTLPEASSARLVVYDSIGREVARLVDGPLPAGVTEVIFEAGRIPSGLYVYRLEAGTFSAMETMLLLK